MMDVDSGEVHDRWGQAAAEIAELTRNGHTIRLISLQGSGVIFALVAGAFSTAASLGPPAAQLPLVVALSALGLGISVTSYVGARRRGRLLPFSFTPTRSSMMLLTAEERKALNRQWRRAGPVAAESAPLVAAVVAYQQSNNRAAMPVVIAMGCGLLAMAVSVSQWQFANAGVAVMTLLFVVDAWRLRKLARQAASPTGTSDR
ncbi:hypothetical protein [Marisediminicola senii]|uniref:hypothetical protein n=1 Tax=Marisediminicola senii TaxID=2711233 RepID=UPI0013ECE150|nr:hypothetical protein [Marisediminicola senii]